jgi:hypothetical protein
MIPMRTKGLQLAVVSLIPAFLLACGPREQIPPQEAQEDRQELTQGLPETNDPEARYLFYLHGQIIEDQGLRPVHPRFGIYEYETIVDTFSSRGITVISEPRERGTDIWRYAQEVQKQVETLLAAGVAPDKITVMGHSKGGSIAIMASSFLKNDEVNFVFLACCGDWMRQRPQIDLHGRILSIYDQSDDLAGSCQKAFEKAAAPLVTREIVLQTGLGHGAFYRPMAEWVGPVVDWVGGE